MNKQLQRLMVLTVMLVVSTAARNNAYAQPNSQARSPIIDVHMHAYAKDPRWDHKIGNPITGQAMTIESAAFLNEQQKRDIFYNNAARFLRLGKK